ncbi:hypothetical protein C8Q77DRAFT_1256669 [Trametes polyzona]|nr:hypothetical protein C8Q77DRAFT_1256669 [Trametes polyzona]
MPSRSKRQANAIVVRPIIPGTRQTTKSVFGTTTQLNKHEPVPWKHPKPRPACMRPQPARRNPGRGNGEWLAPQAVCGRALGPVWDDEEGDDSWQRDVESEWAGDEWADGNASNQGRLPRRTEVRIMDIAKPLKPKGISKDFEVIKTVRRVIALEENQTDSAEWEDRIESDVEMEDWDILDDEDMRQRAQTYATSLRSRHK